MRIRFSFAVSAAAIALALASAQAAAPAYVTNQVQTVNLALTATVQGPIITNISVALTNVYTNVNFFSIATRDFINDMGSLEGTNFTTRAQLLRFSPPAGNPYFVIRDVIDNTNVNFPLGSTNFQNGPLWSVTQSTTSAGRTTGAIYANEYFFLSSYLIGAAMEGYATTTLGSEAMTATVVGSGAFTNAVAIYRGTISFSGQRAETDAITPQSALPPPGPPRPSQPFIKVEP
jgi:hypothetical protein